MPPVSRRGDGGYTILEMMVALSIIALAASASYAGVRLLERREAHVAHSVQGSKSSAGADVAFKRVLAQVDVSGSGFPMLLGSPRGFAATCSGLPCEAVIGENTLVLTVGSERRRLPLASGGPYAFGYSSGVLQLDHWPAVAADGLDAEAPLRIVTLRSKDGVFLSERVDQRASPDCVFDDISRRCRTLGAKP